MSTQGRNLLNKALLRLDRGDHAGAQESLRAAVADAENTDDPVTLVQALVVLGDSLHARGDPSAGDVELRRALAVDLDESEDVVDYEIQRARELLGML